MSAAGISKRGNKKAKSTKPGQEMRRYYRLEGEDDDAGHTAGVHKGGKKGAHEAPDKSCKPDSHKDKRAASASARRDESQRVVPPDQEDDDAPEEASIEHRQAARPKRGKRGKVEHAPTAAKPQGTHKAFDDEDALASDSDKHASGPERASDTDGNSGGSDELEEHDEVPRRGAGGGKTSARSKAAHKRSVEGGVEGEEQGEEESEEDSEEEHTRRARAMRCVPNSAALRLFPELPGWIHV